MNKRHKWLLILIGIVAIVLIVRSMRAKKAEKMATPPAGKGENEQSSYKTDAQKKQDCVNGGGEIIYSNNYPGGWKCFGSKTAKSNKYNPKA